MTYQIVKGEMLIDWALAEDDDDTVDTMLTFLEDLAEDPYLDAQHIPGKRHVYTRPTPAPFVMVTYLVAEQFNAVELLRFTDVGFPGQRSVDEGEENAS